LRRNPTAASTSSSQPYFLYLKWQGVFEVNDSQTHSPNEHVETKLKKAAQLRPQTWHTGLGAEAAAGTLHRLAHNRMPSKTVDVGLRLRWHPLTYPWGNNHMNTQRKNIRSNIPCCSWRQTKHPVSEAGQAACPTNYH
jgi:hypothetical protein